MITEDKVQDVYNVIGKFCLSYDIYSDEMVQDLMSKVWPKLEKHYDENKGKLSTYVYKCCKNFYLMDKRKHKPIIYSLNEECEENIEVIDTLESDYPDPLEELIIEERRQQIDDIYNNCSDLLRSYLDGKTQCELAEEYGISQAHVSRKIKKELEQIRKKVMK